MSDWLDTETRALLKPPPPDKAVATGAVGHSLVLLDRGGNRAMLARAVSRIDPDDPVLASRVSSVSRPLTVKSGITEDEALLGQFELVCADAVSVFVEDDVASDGDRRYLADLYAALRSSPEFAPVQVAVLAIPSSDEGRSFSDQFLGRDVVSSELPLRFPAMTKKARIMQHWGRKIGCEVTVQDGPADR